MDPPPQSVTLRSALTKAGLGGLGPRAAVFAFVPWALWWFAKPAISFCPDGSARQFRKSPNATCDPTWLPHWAIALLGLLAALLV